MKYIKTFEQYINESSINEAKKPKSWDSTFAMNAISAYQNDEFDIDDNKSIEEWDKEYNGGNAPKPAFNTKEIVDYAIKTGKKPDGSKLDESAVNEKRITPPRNGFKLKDIEKILKKSGDLELVANGSHYYINSYMHDNGRLDDATDTSLFAIDQDAEEFEVRLKDIEFIEAF